MTGKSAAAGTADTRLADALGERYLSYALSTITARSLPDVRDGLKPVHRRLLHAMRELRLNPDQGFKKCARIVGDVMGRYHPHGDAAIYDAMVRLAQDFAVRWPLVDGQGNFGNVDGDNAAAMRYTEARLTAVAEALLEGIGEDAVDFRPTYDDEGEEPVVLPANFPNLLANGASGIAVGMATSIPPHNAGEICKALLHLMKFPKATVGKLVGLMPGPDLPTGGVLVEPPGSIVEAYRTGRGGFRLRARWSVEKGRGGTWVIVVDEIPWQVPKSRLVEKIAELMAAKKLPMLADIRDESAADVRLVLEPRSRALDPAAVMEHLFRVTDLEVRVGLNMNVLDATGVPRVMDLREVLQAFIDHRMEVLGRRTRYRVEKVDRRIEVLEGWMVAYLNLDEVIQVIREEDEPKRVMMKRWKLSDAQAEAILNMRLRALRKLEEIAIREELAALREERRDLEALLGDRKRQLARVAGEIRETGKRFGDGNPEGVRRTLIATPPTATVIPLEIAIEREPVTVICSDKGWIRAVRGHLEDGAGLKFKEGDRGRFLIHAQTTDRLLVFGTNGRFYTVGVDRLPRGRGHGEPLRLMIDLGGEAEDIVSISVYRSEALLLVASADGRGFLVQAESVVAQTRQGRQVLNLGEGVEARISVPAAGDTVAVLGENRKLLLFPLADLPEMARGRGVVLQKYHDGGLADAMVFTLADGLTCRTGARQRTFQDLDDWRGKRANAGRKVPAGFPKSGRFDSG